MPLYTGERRKYPSREKGSNLQTLVGAYEQVLIAEEHDLAKRLAMHEMVERAFDDKVEARE